MATPPLIFVLNGPNLNLLGTREPEIYGTDTLDDIAVRLVKHADDLGIELDIRQSNHEGHLIDWLHEAQSRGAKAVILNPGGYSHTSVALHDAVKAIATPVIEVHLSDPEARESFRHTDLVGLAAAKIIKGEGARGYTLALDEAVRL
jgi:3-dehydroquinate dehydratase-2